MTLRTAVTLVAAGAATLAAALPAQAATTTINVLNTREAFGVTAITVPDEAANDNLYAGVTVTNIARGNNLGNPPSSTETHLGIECAAVSTGAAGTGLGDCYARGLNSGEIYRIPSTGAKPGVLDARASVGLRIPMEPFEVCVSARVLLRNLSTFYETPVSCSRT